MLIYLDTQRHFVDNNYIMTGSRIRALCNSVWCEIDCAQNDLVWKENPGVHESLSNAKELLGIIQNAFPADNPDELYFDD